METTPPVLDEDQTLAEIAQAEGAKAAEAAKTEAAKAARESKPAESETPPEEELDPRGVLKYFDEVHGQKQGEKYKDDVAFLAACDELIRMSGKRDEDAVLGKKVRGKLAEDQLTTLLSEGKLPSPKTDKVPAWNPAWVTTDDEGKPAFSPSAPKDVADRYQQMQQRASEFFSDPDSFVQKAMDGRLKEMEKDQQTLKEEIRAEKEDLEIAGWLKQNASAMYVDGDEDKGWSSQGERILAWVRDPDNAAETPRVLTRLKYGMRFAPGEDGKTPRFRPPGRATRKPDVATKSTKAKTIDERVAAGEGLATLLADVMPGQGGA